MTILRGSNAPIGLHDGKPIGTSSGLTPWVRPSDWITFTPPTATENKVVGTVAIWNQDFNYLAVRATTSTGLYTVDWGDGTSTNHTSGTTAEKNYVWSDISSGTLTSRGYRQAIVTITPTTGGATFTNLSLSRKPSVLGATNQTSTSPWLDIAISAPSSIVEFAVSSAGDFSDRVPCGIVEQVQILSSFQTTANYIFRNMYALQSAVYNNSSSVSIMQGMFQNCYSLIIAPFFPNTATATDVSAMFNSCTSLVFVPLYDTPLVTSMSTMFSGCQSLRSVPLFNTASVTNMSNMFAVCRALQSVPLFNTASVTNMGSMFSTCPTIETVPLFNTASVTTMQNMFASCVSLTNVPLFNTANVTSMNNMFQSCSSLQAIPQFNTTLVTNFSGMASVNNNLVEIPELNVSGASSLANSNLVLGNATISSAAASLSRAKLTGLKFTQTFQNCRMGAPQLDEMYTALATLNPAITTVSGNGTTITVTVGTGSISPFVVGRSVTITGVNPVAYNISGTVASVNSGAGTFTITNAATGTYVSGGIASITSDRTITVTGNPGVATDTPSIATNKGWVVTG